MICKLGWFRSLQAGSILKLKAGRDKFWRNNRNRSKYSGADEHRGKSIHGFAIVNSRLSGRGGEIYFSL